MSPSKTVKTVKTQNFDKLIDQWIPKLHQAAKNLRHYGLSRSEIVAEARYAMDEVD